jgi:hypothetical protein
VTGPQLQSAFGLMSTFMRFTTISAARIHRGAPAHVAIQSWPVTMLGGEVFPASKGGVVAIQKLTRRGWRTIKRVGVGSGGSYSAEVPDVGRYRVVFAQVLGPTIALG